MLAIAAFVYAGLQFIEGVGLWLARRWGEYYAVVATSLFIPLEIYELFHHFTILKSITLAVNLAAVVYLLLSKRLFGLRGGRKAYEAELAGNNLLEIIQSSASTEVQRAHSGAAAADDHVVDKHDQRDY